MFMNDNQESTVVQTRVLKTDKEQADEICSQLGLSLNDALRMVIRQIVNTNSIPVKLTIDNMNESYSNCCCSPTKKNVYPRF